MTDWRWSKKSDTAASYSDRAETVGALLAVKDWFPIPHVSAAGSIKVVAVHLARRDGIPRVVVAVYLACDRVVTLALTES